LAEPCIAPRASTGNSAKAESENSETFPFWCVDPNCGVANPPDSGLVGLDDSDIGSIRSNMDEFRWSKYEWGEFGSDDIADEPVAADCIDHRLFLGGAYAIDAPSETESGED
jgi:hypothetical protein